MDNNIASLSQQPGDFSCVYFSGTGGQKQDQFADSQPHGSFYRRADGCINNNIYISIIEDIACGVR